MTGAAADRKLTLTLSAAGAPPPGPVVDGRAGAPCDVCVLVAWEGEQVLPGPAAPVVVPFGGAEHDWAALELGAWIAAATGAELSLLGAAGQTEERVPVSRRLADVGLLLQQYAGVPGSPVVVGPGPTAVLDAAEGAALLVIGLSDRWRQEGLGEARGALARSAPVPVLFVRRGHRPGALAPPEDVTRFTWSASTSAAGSERPAAHARRSVRSLDAPGQQPHGAEQEPGHEPAEDEQ